MRVLKQRVVQLVPSLYGVRTMATASKFLLTPETSGCYHVNGINKESAAKASELLQKNYEDTVIFFNEEGFYSASPSELQKAYDDNIAYQRPPRSVHQGVSADLTKPSPFAKHLGDPTRYGDYLQFFQTEIDRKGFDTVINEYIFYRDERAEDLLVRLHAAMIAEALAETAVHENWLTSYCQGLEAADAKKSEKMASTKSLAELIDDIHSNEKLSTTPHWDDVNKLRDGVLARAGKEMMEIAAKWIARPDEIDEKLAEMTNAAVYFTIAAQHPPKQVKFDFFYMHCVTSTIFFRAFMSAPWLSPQNKARLLEFKGRTDLALYASQRAPALLPDDGEVWPQLFQKVRTMSDDGHGSKFLRAIASAAEISHRYEGIEGLRIRENDWEKLGQIALESVLDKGAKWVRSAGFDEAWVDYEDRPRAQL